MQLLPFLRSHHVCNEDTRQDFPSGDSFAPVRSIPLVCCLQGSTPRPWPCLCVSLPTHPLARTLSPGLSNVLTSQSNPRTFTPGGTLHPRGNGRARTGPRHTVDTRWPSPTPTWSPLTPTSSGATTTTATTTTLPTSDRGVCKLVSARRRGKNSTATGFGGGTISPPSKSKQ